MVIEISENYERKRRNIFIVWYAKSARLLWRKKVEHTLPFGSLPLQLPPPTPPSKTVAPSSLTGESR